MYRYTFCNECKVLCFNHTSLIKWSTGIQKHLRGYDRFLLTDEHFHLLFLRRSNVINYERKLEKELQN